jgi:hypothetical protein
MFNIESRHEANSLRQSQILENINCPDWPGKPQNHLQGMVLRILGICSPGAIKQHWRMWHLASRASATTPEHPRSMPPPSSKKYYTFRIQLILHAKKSNTQPQAGWKWLIYFSTCSWLFMLNPVYLEVSKNGGTPKTSKLRPLLYWNLLKPMVWANPHFKNPPD